MTTNLPPFLCRSDQEKSTTGRSPYAAAAAMVALAITITSLLMLPGVSRLVACHFFASLPWIAIGGFWTYTVVAASFAGMHQAVGAACVSTLLTWAMSVVLDDPSFAKAAEACHD